MPLLRKLVLGVLLIAALVGVAPIVLSPAVQALPDQSTTVFYYADENFTTALGWQMLLRCNGTTGPVHGQKGPYVMEFNDDCNPGPDYPEMCWDHSDCIADNPNTWESLETCVPYGPRVGISCPES